jgi:hypothetical protein
VKIKSVNPILEQVYTVIFSFCEQQAAQLLGTEPASTPNMQTSNNLIGDERVVMPDEIAIQDQISAARR